eukprot:543_3
MSSSQAMAARLQGYNIEPTSSLAREFGADPKNAFDKLDTNRNRKLTKEELRRGFRGLASEDHFEMLWKLADRDGDGNVVFEEFERLMQLLSVKQQV